MRRVTMLRLATLVGIAACTAMPAQAQQYPAQDIHFICGFPAGTGADAIVRFYAEKVKAITGKTVRATYSEDAGLLGGVTVRVGSTIYDGSIRHQLQAFRNNLTQD